VSRDAQARSFRHEPFSCFGEPESRTPRELITFSSSSSFFFRRTPNGTPEAAVLAHTHGRGSRGPEFVAQRASQRRASRGPPDGAGNWGL